MIELATEEGAYVLDYRTAHLLFLIYYTIKKYIIKQLRMFRCAVRVLLHDCGRQQYDNRQNEINRIICCDNFVSTNIHV